MRQCDHPPCPTDGSVRLGDKIYCVHHAKAQSFPQVAQPKPEPEPIKKVPKKVKSESER